MTSALRFSFNNFISTHALTWSATFLLKILYLRYQISTHALTWSATILIILPVVTIIISTHALTWSAT